MEESDSSEPAIEAVELVGLKAGALRVDLDDGAVCGVEPEVLVLELLQAEDEESRGTEQDDGDSCLGDDQSSLSEGGVAAGGAVGAAQGLDGIGMRSEPCRRDAEEQAGEQRRGKGKCHDDGRGARADADGVVLEGETKNEPRSAPGNDHAGSAAE